jgi:hypothetical protein
MAMQRKAKSTPPRIADDFRIIKKHSLKSIFTEAKSYFDKFRLFASYPFFGVKVAILERWPTQGGELQFLSGNQLPGG